MRRDPQTVLVLAAAGIFVVSLVSSGGAQRPAPQGRRGGPPGPAQPAANASSQAGEATTRRLCGICHPFEHVVAIRRTRSQWEATVESMIARGARGTSAEFAAVIDYLSDSYGLGTSIVRGAAGPDDKPLVDPKASEMAKPLWISDCQSCHGADARGTPKGPNLVRSIVVLHDRYGSTLGPYLRKEHPPITYTATAPAPTVPSAGTRTPAAAAPGLTDTQVLLLAHFLRDRVNDTLRGAPAFKPGDVLIGDPKAGAEYFNGEGGCAKCHSPTGDLAGTGARLEPVAIQQRFLFPMNVVSRGRSGSASGPVTTVTVTTETGETLSGELITMDDFDVSLKDAAGVRHTIRRTPRTRVVKDDPFAAHIDLLSRISDQNIHDVVAYLASLK